MTIRILLFSVMAAFLVYVPFYYFAPVYRELYIHVPPEQLNWWVVWCFRPPHGGAQLYIAYILMYAVLAFAFISEYFYKKIVSSQLRWIMLSVAAAASFFYFKRITFSPPMADIRVDQEGMIFIVFAVILAFIFDFFSKRKGIEWFLMVLLLGACMFPPVLTFMVTDYFYILSPALRTLHGFALNQSYFQYDCLLSFLGMAWIKLNLPIDRFYMVASFSNWIFYMGIFLLAKNFFYEKRLAAYFIISLILIKVYGNILDTSGCPQVCAVRLDEWLVILALAYWRGPQHWVVGIAMGFFQIFHHTFGMIYSIAYMFLVLNMLVLNVLKDTRRGVESFKETCMRYLPNIVMIAAGFLINYIFISLKSFPILDYEKYNVGFMPIGQQSFFWYVPVIVSCAFLLLWKSSQFLSPRYFQTGVFLIFLAIGNLLYFFGRSHANNLINIAASLWLIFFMLADLIMYRLPQRFTDSVKKTVMSLLGILIVGIVAYFYSGRAIDRIKMQVFNLPKLGELFKAETKNNYEYALANIPASNIDFDLVRLVTRDNANIIFLSVKHDFEYYYHGGYVPPEFCPLEGQCFMKDLAIILHQRLLAGADIIVPEAEFSPLIETILIQNPKYVSKYDGFYYLSENPPAL